MRNFGFLWKSLDFTSFGILDSILFLLERDHNPFLQFSATRLRGYAFWIFKFYSLSAKRRYYSCNARFWCLQESLCFRPLGILDLILFLQKKRSRSFFELSQGNVWSYVFWEIDPHSCSAKKWSESSFGCFSCLRELLVSRFLEMQTSFFCKKVEQTNFSQTFSRETLILRFFGVYIAFFFCKKEILIF